MKAVLNISIVIYEQIPPSVFALLDVFAREELVHRVFVVDNSATKHDNFSTYSVEYIFNNGQNLGYGAAHNIAMRKTLAEGVPFHLVINPDVKIEADVLPALLQKMANDASVGLLMPQVISPDGERQYLCKLLPAPSDLLLRKFLPRWYAQKRQSRFEMRFADYDTEFEVPYLSGCFMLLRTAVLAEVGLFDERFFLYPEDLDLSRRMFTRAKNLYFPQVKIVHAHERASYKSLRMLSLHAWNMAKYFCKWGWMFDAERKAINRKILNENLK